MNPIRIAVLVLGVAAAGGAVMLAMSPKPQAPAPVVALAPAPPPVPIDEILVATRDLPLGKMVTAGDVSWQTWPKQSLAGFMIRHDDKAMAEVVGAIVRSTFYAGEPIRQERLIKGAASGFLSAVLPSGMRAVAISIDAQGSTSAGGFVLPNDRVDVIRTVRGGGGSSPLTAGNDNYVSETLLTNVKVLAIGQSVQDKNGAPTQVGSTATLELDPLQAETVILAQRTGQLSLALRSMQDAGQTGAINLADGKTTVIRYGIEADAGSR